MKTLYRAAGRFTALKGTDRILHFIQALPNAIHASTDAYEVVLYRSLRRAVRDGTVTSVEPDGSSFYLLVASIFFRLITRKFRPVQRIRHLNAKLGAEFEGLKLFAETREINPVYFDPIFPYQRLRDEFEVLHTKMDRLGSNVKNGVAKTLSTYEPSSDDHKMEILEFLDYFKDNSTPITPILSNIFKTGDPNKRLLAVVRCTWDEPVHVTNIFGVSFTLPSVNDLRRVCQDRRLFGSLLYLEGFDRDFLLPFEGSCGVALVYLTRDREDLFVEAGFNSLQDKSDEATRAVISYQNLARTKSYDDLFSSQLPELAADKQTDWHTWKKHRDWNPAVLDWKTGYYRGDAMIMATAFSGSPMATKLAPSLINDNFEDPLLSTEGFVYSAAVLNENSPLESLYAIFTALQRSLGNPRQIAYLAELLKHRTGGTFSTQSIVNFETNNGLTTRGAIAYLCQTLKAIGWLRSAESENLAKTAIYEVFKNSPAHLAEALVGLKTAVSNE